MSQVPAVPHKLPELDTTELKERLDADCDQLLNRICNVAGEKMLECSRLNWKQDPNFFRRNRLRLMAFFAIFGCFFGGCLSAGSLRQWALNAGGGAKVAAHTSFLAMSIADQAQCQRVGMYPTQPQSWEQMRCNTNVRAAVCTVVTRCAREFLKEVYAQDVLLVMENCWNYAPVEVIKVATKEVVAIWPERQSSEWEDAFAEPDTESEKRPTHVKRPAAVIRAAQRYLESLVLGGLLARLQHKSSEQCFGICKPYPDFRPFLFEQVSRCMEEASSGALKWQSRVVGYESTVNLKEDDYHACDVMLWTNEMTKNLRKFKDEK